MARTKSQYQCTECGASAPKWSGQCAQCERWNTMVETVVEPAATQRHRGLVEAQPVVRLDAVAPETVARLATGSEEFDRVLGGGLVAGSVVLIGGDPGIGKSTLLLQTLAHLCVKASALYVSGEESVGQIALRARRLGLGELALPVLAEIELERICAEIERSRPAVVVIDSIQTMVSTQLQSAPGSVA
ncbi:MAG: DNA repair protein RadA, partial [Betaproteobacteria bacterium]|nr:DNA repair protein RadA [Betaproteobacteria bacterium]